MKLSYYYLSVFLLILGCVPSPETYDPSVDDGTYTGQSIVYEGEGTDPSFIARVCPNIAASIVVSNGSINFSLTDTYPSYAHHASVELVHTGSTSVSLNNQFGVTYDWAPETTDVQLNDIMLLKLCGSDFNTLDSSNVRSLTLKFGSKGFTGEFGFGQARASIMYGVSCNTGEFLPVCIYYWEGTR